MKRRIVLAAAMALAVTACGGNGAEETRNAVITPKVTGGNTTGTFAWVSSLDYDATSKSVFGGGWIPQVEEGLVLRGAGILDTGNPSNLTVPAAFPEVYGSAETVVPDGKGGWFVAGRMVSVGTVTGRHLVHVNADGSVDPAFQADVLLKENLFGRSEQVLLLADHPASPEHLVMVARVSKVGESTLAADAANCARILVVNKTNGAVSDRIDLDGSCADSAVLWGRQIVFSGDFAIVNGRARNRVAGIDLVTKAVSNVGSDFGTAYPTFAAPNSGQTVSSIAVAGDTLYLLGRITKAGQLAATLDLATGLVNRWKPAELLPAGVLNWQLDGATMLVSKDRMTVAGCLGGITPAGFASYDRVTGARGPWDPRIQWQQDPCTAGFSAIATGDTLLVQGQFTQVNGTTAPNVVWLGPDAAARPVQLPVAVRYWDWAEPHSPIRNARYFPDTKRMFVSVDAGRLMVNGRNMGPYLAADDTGVTRETRLEWTLPDQRIAGKHAVGGKLYVLSTPVSLDENNWDPAVDLAATRIIHRFDAATGSRDTGFEINHTGLVAHRIVVGETLIAVIGSMPADGGLGSHIWFYSKSDGRYAGVFPDESIAARWPWPVTGASAQGDTLFTYGQVPDGAGRRFALTSIDMRTGAARLYGVDLGTSEACWCDPVAIGSVVFAPKQESRRPSFWRAVDIESGTTVRDMTEWGMSTELPPVKVGSRIIGTTFARDGFAFLPVDPGTLEPSGTFASGVRLDFASALLGTADRLFAWVPAPVRQADGTVLTGLVAFDTDGRPTMASVPDIGQSTVVQPLQPVEVPSLPGGLTGPVASPAEELSRRSADASAGRIFVSGVQAGNRSLTVQFVPNGNDGPYEVREVGGTKVCSTSGNSCTFQNLTAHARYSFTVEAKGRADETRSQPTSAAKPVVTLKKGKTLRLSTVMKPAAKTNVRWKSSKACVLNASRGTLVAPKRNAVCTVTVTSKVTGKPAVARSLTVIVG